MSLKAREFFLNKMRHQVLMARFRSRNKILYQRRNLIPGYTSKYDEMKMFVDETPMESGDADSHLREEHFCELCGKYTFEKKLCHDCQFTVLGGFM